MKHLSFVSSVALVCLSGRVLAQNCVATALAVIPSCAQNCIVNGAPSIGCGGTDFSCQCQQTAALMAAVEGCVQSSCPSASYQAVIDGASTVCDCAAPVALAAGTASVSGISGTVPASVTATATASGVTGTAGGSSSASSSGTVITSGPSATSEGGQGNGATWTGYTSVSNVATASVIGAAAQATAPSNIMHYLVPAAMVGAALL